MPTVTIEADVGIDRLRRLNNELYRRSPCRERTTCIAKERERPLTAEERKCLRWVERPYSSYDQLRMCTSCLRFWLIECAARLEELPGIIAEERPKLPQKG